MPDIPFPAVADNRRLVISVKGRGPLPVGTRIVDVTEDEWPVELKIPGVIHPTPCRVIADRKTGSLRILTVEIFQGPLLPW